MDLKRILAAVDHTLLAPEATWAQIQSICDDAMAYHTATVCIPANYVARCKAYMQDKENRVGICTVIGFPNGYSTTAVKVFETADAVKNGADEIDYVVNLVYVKSGDFKAVEREMRHIVSVCHRYDRIVKVIFENCYLTEKEKEWLASQEAQK